MLWAINQPALTVPNMCSSLTFELPTRNAATAAQLLLSQCSLPALGNHSC